MATLKIGRTVTTQKIFVASLYAAALVVIGLCSRVQAQMLLWDQVVSKAKKEGKVVVSIPPGAELRKSLKEVFEKRFAIELELVTGRGAAVAKKIRMNSERACVLPTYIRADRHRSFTV